MKILPTVQKHPKKTIATAAILAMLGFGAMACPKHWYNGNDRASVNTAGDYDLLTMLRNGLVSLNNPRARDAYWRNQDSGN